MSVPEFRRAFEAGDHDAAFAQLAPECAFYHAGHVEPTTDQRILRPALRLAREAFGSEFRFTDHLVGDVFHALPWTARINALAAEGVDLLRVDPDGRIRELRILMRPYEAIGEFMAAMRAASGKAAPHTPPPSTEHE